MIDFHKEAEVERYHKAVKRFSQENQEDGADDVDMASPLFVPCFNEDASQASSKKQPRESQRQQSDTPAEAAPPPSSPQDEACDEVVGPWYERDIEVETPTKGGASQKLTISIRRRKLRVVQDQAYEAAGSVAAMSDLIYESPSVHSAASQGPHGPTDDGQSSQSELADTASEDGGGWVPATAAAEAHTDDDAHDDDIDDVDRLAALFGVPLQDRAAREAADGSGASQQADKVHGSAGNSAQAATDDDVECVLSGVSRDRRRRAGGNMHLQRQGRRRAPARVGVAAAT